MRHILQKFRRANDGAVTVESSLLIMILIVLTAGAIEAGYAFYQWNGAQMAARTGVRIAATSDPVARDISTMTGLSRNVSAGDPFPAYARSCDSSTSRCSRGGYDAAAMQRIVFGPDNDGQCAATARPRRGMCDVFALAENAKITVDYIGSGLGRAGAQADPAPLVSVTISEVPVNFVFLDLVGFKNIVHLPPVEATLMGEDLKNG